MAKLHGQFEPMLTASEVARVLNLHINTVRRWSYQGTLKSYHIGSIGDRRFCKDDVDAFYTGNGELKNEV
jgi:excisionase family DNA binding protein